MKNKLFIFLLSSMMCGIFEGCATMMDVLSNKEGGTMRGYDVSEKQAWEIVITLLRWEGCETIEEHRNQNYLLTGSRSMGQSAFIGAWIEPLDSSHTKITFVTRRESATQLYGVDEDRLQYRFVQALNILKSGNQIPINAPVVPHDRNH